MYAGLMTAQCAKTCGNCPKGIQVEAKACGQSSAFQSTCARTVKPPTAKASPTCARIKYVETSCKSKAPRTKGRGLMFSYTRDQEVFFNDHLKYKA